VSVSDLFEEIVRLRRAGIPAALATIVSTRGSTPGRETMRLLVREDGTFVGTVGGGCLEAEVYATARKVIAEERPATLKFRLTEFDSPDSGLLCGGEVTVFVESITVPTLVIFGGGHISRVLSHVAAMAGFRVVVADDRESYADRDRFPEAAEVVMGPYEDVASTVSLHSNSYVIVVTRGHKDDGVVLKALAARGERPRFVGMIGSKTKRAVLLKKLREEGVDEGWLARVRSPVGVQVGARTHEEIAIAIVAEMIKVRREGADAAEEWKHRKGVNRGAAPVDSGSEKPESGEPG
jgi:xanthine dehydrogenase accessory factor